MQTYPVYCDKGAATLMWTYSKNDAAWYRAPKLVYTCSESKSNCIAMGRLHFQTPAQIPGDFHVRENQENTVYA